MPARLALSLLLLTSCSDYALKGDGPSAEATMDLDLSPRTVDLVACGVQARTVTLSSVGTAAVEVTAVELWGGGWSMDPVTVPFSLAAGESVDLVVQAADGDATLRVESSDPAEPVIEVPLSAVADAPPVAAITAPGSGAILSSGVDLELSGSVSDDVDAAELLSLSWASDVDGTISTEPAAPTGEVAATWAAGRTAGPHVVTLAATDSCGQQAVATVEVCQDEGYTVDELDISSWHFEGVAGWSEADGWLELTPATTDVVGTAFATDETISGDAVDIAFRFSIGGGTGADGISLTVLDTTRMSTFLGGTGCGIGYGGDASCTAGPALPGWSVEVDTYWNDGQDPTDQDHVMFTFDGDVDGGEVWASLPEMEDTGWHLMEVSVTSPHVTVAIDGIVYIDTDLSGFTSFPGYVGFTAGTGGQTNQHLIDSLEVTAHTCEAAEG